jgi:hypothetical protein
MKAGTWARLSGIILLILLSTPLLDKPAAGTVQPSSDNNILYLRYNTTSEQGWMSAEPVQSSAEYIQTGTGFLNTLSFTFPLVPTFVGPGCLILNTSNPWAVNLHIVVRARDGPAALSYANASMCVGNYSFSSDKPMHSGDWYRFLLNSSLVSIPPRTDINFNFTLTGYGCTTGLIIRIYTEGSSQISAPIEKLDPDTDQDGSPDSQDPDDDNDGHNDTSDAYPLDVTRWKKPETAHPTPPWLYASPVLVLLAVIVAAFHWRRRKRLRSAAPPHK